LNAARQFPPFTARWGIADPGNESQTLTAKNVLAGLLNDLGERGEARALYEEVIACVGGARG